MNNSVILSCVFIIAYGFLYISLFFFKKSERKLNGMTWFVINIIFTFWINAFFAGIMNLICIPLNLVTFSVVYLILGVFNILLARKIGWQQYDWKLSDVFSLGTILVCATWLGVKQHTLAFRVSYFTSDPAVHFKQARHILEAGTIEDGMYYAQLNNALILNAASSFFNSFQYYKLFVIIDIIMLIISGWIFYAVLREKIKNKKSVLILLIMALIYMIGYPLNNKLFGFVYLGMAVTIIAVIIYLLDALLTEKITEQVCLVGLMLGCYSLVVCYMLFAPFVYCMVLLVLVIRYKKAIISKRGILKCLEVFALPCILGIYYCYFNYFKTQNIKVSDAIAANGAIYGEVYCNFVFFLPIVIYMLIRYIKKKEHFELLIFFAGFLSAMALMLILVFGNRTSFYYYYKVQYAMWLVVCMITYEGIVYMLQKDRSVLLSYISVLAMLLVCWLGGFNQKIVDKEREMGYSDRSATYFTVGFGIFDYNFANLNLNYQYNDDKMKLYKYVDKHYKKDQIIPVLADINNYQDCFWYEAINGVNMKKYYIWNSDLETVLKEMKNNKDTIAIFLYENPVYSECENQIKQSDIIYQNTAGCIVNLQ